MCHGRSCLNRDVQLTKTSGCSNLVCLNERGFTPRGECFRGAKAPISMSIRRSKALLRDPMMLSNLALGYLQTYPQRVAHYPEESFQFDVASVFSARPTRGPSHHAVR